MEPHPALTARHDPERHLDYCREHLDADWTLAFAVLDDLIARQDWPGAISLAETAMRLALDLKTDETWAPADTLAIALDRFCYRTGWLHALVPLLRQRSVAARRGGDVGEAAALTLQADLVACWEDLDAATAALQAAHDAGGQVAARRLRAQRAKFVALHCARSWSFALTDALAEGGGEATSSLHRDLRAWLARAAEDGTAFDDALPALRTLTCDLGPGTVLEVEAPSLMRQLSPMSVGKGGTLEASRRRCLARLSPSTLAPEVLDVWRRHASRLIPDPAKATGSRYDDCAAWLAVLRELDGESCGRILGAWRIAHARRRNLWDALAARGLRAGGR